MDLDTAANDLRQAYSVLIAALGWERDRILKLAEEIAREHGPEKAKEVLERQDEYIREQAYR